MSSAGVASVKALKAVFLPIPQYVHMCHILLNSENPEVLQLLMSQDVHILVSAKFFPVVTCSHKQGCGRKNSIKGILKSCKLGVQQSSARAYIVDDIIPIHDSNLLLANNETKDSLTFYLANKVLQLKVPVVTVTRLHVKSNMNDVQPSTGVSTQEKADALIVLHTAEICDLGM